MLLAVSSSSTTQIVPHGTVSLQVRELDQKKNVLTVWTLPTSRLLFAVEAGHCLGRGHDGTCIAFTLSAFDSKLAIA